MMMMFIMMMILSSRSQGKDREAVTLLKDSIRFGPHFADAYSSLASLYAEQVKHPESAPPPPTHAHAATHPYFRTELNYRGPLTCMLSSFLSALM